MIVLLVIVALFGEAGEVGVRTESPAPAGLAWIGQTWQWREWSFSGWVGSRFLPLSFHRASLKLSWTGPNSSFSAEGVVLGSGRLDFFLSGSAKGHMVLQGLTLSGQVGGKGGLVAVNIAPFGFLTTWAILSLETDDFSGELSLEGPSPWQTGVRLESGPVALSLGSSFSLTISSGENEWNTTTLVQLWPKPLQTHTLRWAVPDREFHLTLHSSGQVWCRVSVTKEGWTVSAFFSLASLRLTQTVFEVVRNF